MTREEFRTLAARGLILDGGTGTNLFLAGMPRDQHAETWLPEHPQAIIDLQQAYEEAGSQVVYAPSFTASRFYHEENLDAMNREMVALSRRAVKNAFVAGDMTTSSKFDLEEDDMRPVYHEQAEILVDAGVDLFAIETLMGEEEALAAVRETRALCELPIMCSFSVTPQASFYFGGNLYDIAPELEKLGADAVGVNCAFGPDGLRDIIAKLRTVTSLPIIAKPNAGSPKTARDGSTYYDLTPEDFASQMLRLMEAGATVVGGCCGTKPAHIAALTGAVRGRA